MKLVEVLKVLVAAAAMAMTAAEAISLELPTSEIKCVYEDLRKNVVVLANYFVISDAERTLDQANPFPTVSIKVTSPFGNKLHHEQNVTYGQFAFTTVEPGNYLACFQLDSHVTTGSKNVSIDIRWKTGIDANDWDSIARKEKIEGVGLELMKLEGLVEAVHGNLVYLKEREEEMRRVSERTNAAVAWFSTLSLCICILAAALQIWYLKRFFRKKKLI